MRTPRMAFVALAVALALMTTASAASAVELNGAGRIANQITNCGNRLSGLAFNVHATSTDVVARTASGTLTLQLPAFDCTLVTMTGKVTCLLDDGDRVLAWGEVQAMAPPGSVFADRNFISLASTADGTAVSPLATFIGFPPDCTDPFLDELLDFGFSPVIAGSVRVTP